MTIYNDQLSSYITSLFAQEDDALQYIRLNTPKRGLPTINITPEEGRFLQFLVRACDARKALEIGTLGGYSGTWIARGLPVDGLLITLEVEPYHAEVAAEHFSLAGVHDQVTIMIGDAHQTLRQLKTDAPFDFIFIDADKLSYPMYYDWALEHTRLGAIITAHNVFRTGGILEQESEDQNTETIRQFNNRLANDPNLISTIYPAGDGTLLAVRTT